jgi:hypothetical protein
LGYQFEDDDEDEESGIWIGKDGVGFERVEFPDCEPSLACAALFANGTWTLEGGFTPLKQELVHMPIFELQVCMHVSQL